MLCLDTKQLILIVITLLEMQTPQLSRYKDQATG